MRDKLSKLRKRGPVEELDPAVEMDMELPEDEMNESEELPGVEGEELIDESSAGVEEVISMLGGLGSDDLVRVQEELDMLMESGDEMDEMDYEDEDEELV